MYYFDYASTTKPSQKNIDLYTKLLNDIFLHSDSDEKTMQIENEAKQMILSSLKLNNTYDVVFTSGGTEANNLAIIGYANAFGSKKHFITTKYEHSSVDSCFKHLEEQGHDVTYLNINKDGLVDLKQLESELTESTVLVSIMTVNNELGSKNDIAEIKKIINRQAPNCRLMADSVQSVGKTEVNYQDIDLITISGHKLYAPKWIGALIYKKDINLTNTIYGGQQQNGLRPGTNSVPLEVTLAFAVKTEMECLSESIKHTNEMLDVFAKFIESEDKLELNIPLQTTTASVCFKTKALSESIMTVLKANDIYASTRSACSVKLNIPSRSLTSIGLDKQAIDRTIRFSFSKYTTRDEVEYLIEKIKEIIAIY